MLSTNVNEDMRPLFQSYLALLSNRKTILKSTVKTSLKIALVVLRALPFLKPVVVYVLKFFPKMSARLYIFARSHRSRERRDFLYTLGDIEKEDDPISFKMDDTRVAIDQVPDLLQEIGVIYYWIDHTVQFPKNTGIQRVARQLARSLMDLGAKLIPVRWDHQNCCFARCSSADLNYFSQWNGPSADAWANWQDPGQTGEHGWLFVPEVVYYLDEVGMKQLQVYAHSKELKSAWIYFDSLPLTLSHIYNPSITAAHEEYMLGLCHFDQILAISRYSAREFTEFHAQIKEPKPNFETMVNACSLPGEFLETTRSFQIKESREDLCQILCIATAEPRKNHVKLLLAFDLLQSRTKRKFELVLVGRPSDPKINTMIMEYTKKYANVRWEQDVGDSLLSNSMNNAISPFSLV